jgi:transcription initiation factor TFIID subunit 13
MTEPRARPRTKGQLFHTSDLTDLLYAYGTACRTPNTPSPLPSTISVLDEILTDFIIETCHAAALSASYSRRQKIKVDDFKFVLRKDSVLLGRVQEQLWRERRIKEARSLIDVRKEAEMNLSGLVEVAEQGGVGEEMRKGKKRRRARRAEDVVEVEGVAKKVRTET